MIHGAYWSAQAGRAIVHANRARTALRTAGIVGGEMTFVNTGLNQRSGASFGRALVDALPGRATYVAYQHKKAVGGN